MSRDAETSLDNNEETSTSSYLWYLILIPVLLVGGIVLVLTLGDKTAPSTNGGNVKKQSEESNLELAQQTLARHDDLGACRGALQQINAETREKPDLRSPPMTNEEKDWLRKHVSLDESEMTEIDGGTYTLLDGHHLERCFLMRDAVRALEVKSTADGGEKPLHRVVRLFAWVVRQVRLRPNSGDVVPTTFALRRGWGSAADRARVFLALLEQIGDKSGVDPEALGFLLNAPDDAGRMRLWACGVVLGDGKDVYLFDPRLGLPLPGANGKGVATLAEVRRHPDVLAQLDANDKQRYDVTAKQASAAQAELVCPLSALSPRMRHLQQKLLAPAVRVRLAVEPMKTLQRVEAAAGTVRIARDKVTLLRRFIPANDGGAETATSRPGNPRMPSRRDRFTMAMVPWTTFPPLFRDNPDFPLESELGQRMKRTFAASFVLPVLEKGQSRDLLLRGRYSAAEPELVKEREQGRDQQKQLANAVDLDKRARQWIDLATHAYAARLRASPAEKETIERHIRTLWDRRHAAPIYALLLSAVAEARNPEVSYQLGLCSQEQAELLQARLDPRRRAGEATAAEIDRVRQAWQDARNAWKQHEDDYPQHVDRAAARRLRGRAEAMLGDRQAAVDAWKNHPESMPITDLEKLAFAYLIRQIDK